MKEEKITLTTSDLPISYVPYTNDNVDVTCVSTAVVAKCALCEKEFGVSMFSTRYEVICPRCKRAWKKFLAMYDDAPVGGEN